MSDQTLTLNGLRLHYQVEGQGPDVLFIHGWASSRRMWTHLSTGLAATHRCWALDLPGFGDSEKPAPDWYSIANYTTLLAAFLRAVGIERADMVGHSMGGMIALDFAAAHSALTTRLVAINPVVTGRRARLRPLAHWGPSRQVLAWTHQFTPPLLLPVLNLGFSQHPVVQPLRRRFEEFTRTTPAAMWHSGQALLHHDLTARLAHITTPTLICLSTVDLMVASGEGRLAAKLIPGARLVIVRAGHMATDDAPRLMLHHLREFLI